MKLRNFLKMLGLLGVQFGIDGNEGGGAGSTGGADDAARKAAEEAAAAEAARKAAEEAAKKNAGNQTTDKEAELLKEVMSKKAALKEAADREKQLKEQLAKFDGIDLDKVKALLQEKADAETKQLEAKGEWDRLKASLVEQHAAEKTKLEERIAELANTTSGKDQLINKLTIGNAFGNSKFIGDELQLTPAKAQILYGDHFEFDGEKIIAYDKPRSASGRTPLINAAGDTLSFEEAIKKIIDADPDKDTLIKAKQKSGAGSSTIPGKTSERQPELTGKSKIQAALQAKISK